MDEKLRKDIEILHEMLENSRYTVFFGGAGMSTESGIPDFRGTADFIPHRARGTSIISAARVFSVSPRNFSDFSMKIWSSPTPSRTRGIMLSRVLRRRVSYLR